MVKNTFEYMNNLHFFPHCIKNRVYRIPTIQEGNGIARIINVRIPKMSTCLFK